ncbi:MAG: hypothetical protein WA718_10550 [Terriglobales bacterium]
MFKNFALVALLVISGVMLAAPVVAQNTWRIDPEHSTARLVLASSRNPDAGVNVGVARASGVIDQNGGDSSNPNFDFTIWPADRNGGKISDDPASDPDYTVISFKSTRVVPVNEETVRVTGQLTLNYVERPVTYDANEAYSGPAYGPAVHHSVTREATFQFHPVNPSGIQKAKDTNAEWISSSTINAEDFPQLLDAVSSTNWPAFVADEKCSTPSNVGEDYSGASCTGETVERTARTDVRCEMPSTLGEDFAGEVCAQTSPDQAANKVQMQLDLHLVRTASALSASAGQ